MHDAADFQVPRIASARGISEPELRPIIRAHTAPRQFGLLGERRVNVLESNLALDSAPLGDRLRLSHRNGVISKKVSTHFLARGVSVWGSAWK